MSDSGKGRGQAGGEVAREGGFRRGAGHRRGFEAAVTSHGMDAEMILLRAGQRAFLAWRRGGRGEKDWEAAADSLWGCLKLVREERAQVREAKQR